MDKHTKELSEKYMKHPPEGMITKGIKNMKYDDLLDMDCFLNKDYDGVLG